jgi:transcription-repair coupling factor (superfamily II helicase)
MTLKTELRALEVLGCEASAKAVTLHLRDDTPLDAVALTKALASGELSYKLTPDMRLTRRSAPGEIFPSGLEATDRLLSEIQRFVKR